MIICNKKLRLGYVTVTKVASNSFTQFVRNQSDPSDTYTSLDHKNLKRYFVFSFVRDPYSRAVSMYDYLIKTPYSTKHPRLTADLTFNEFIHLLAEMGVNEDVHTMHQEHQIPREHINYIGKLEHLERDIQPIIDRFGLLWPNTIVPALNFTTKESENVWTAELRDIVYELYKSDFKAYGYTR